MLMKYSFIIFIIVILVYSCVPDTGDKSSQFDVSLADVEIQKIINLGDKRDIKSLYPYLRHPNTSYRYQALQMFASIKNAEANDSIYRLLSDSNLQIRAAAAYAIGQSGDSKSAVRLISAFRGKDTIGVDNIFNANILEAVGKVGQLEDLKALATVKTYRVSDSLLLLGQAKAIFRMANRNIVCEEGTSKMVDILQSTLIPNEIKIYAAHYLARAKDINLDLAKVRLTEIFNKERNPEIRGPIAIALGKSKDTIFIPVLKTCLLYTSMNSIYNTSANHQMAMYRAPSVAGWQAYYQEPNYYKLWLNSVSLPARKTYTDLIAGNGQTIGSFRLQFDILKTVNKFSKPDDANTVVNEIGVLLFAKPLAANQVAHLKTFLSLGTNDSFWTTAYNAYKAAPTDNVKLSTVVTRLRSMVIYMMRMPEYHLS